MQIYFSQIHFNRKRDSYAIWQVFSWIFFIVGDVHPVHFIMGLFYHWSVKKLIKIWLLMELIKNNSLNGVIFFDLKISFLWKQQIMAPRVHTSKQKHLKIGNKTFAFQLSMSTSVYNSAALPTLWIFTDSESLCLIKRSYEQLHNFLHTRHLIVYTIRHLVNLKNDVFAKTHEIAINFRFCFDGLREIWELKTKNYRNTVRLQ